MAITDDKSTAYLVAYLSNIDGFCIITAELRVLLLFSAHTRGLY